MREIKLAFKDFWNHRLIVVIIIIILCFTVSFSYSKIFEAYRFVSSSSPKYSFVFYNKNTSFSNEDKKTLVNFIYQENIMLFSLLPINSENNSISWVLYLINFPKVNDEKIIKIIESNAIQMKGLIRGFDLEIDQTILENIRYIVQIDESNIEMIRDQVFGDLIKRMNYKTDIDYVTKYNALNFKDIYTKIRENQNLITPDVLFVYSSLVIFSIIVIIMLYKIIQYISLNMLKEYEIQIFYGAKARNVIARSCYYFLFIFSVIGLIVITFFKLSFPAIFMLIVAAIQIIILLVLNIFYLKRLNVLRRGIV